MAVKKVELQTTTQPITVEQEVLKVEFIVSPETVEQLIHKHVGELLTWKYKALNNECMKLAGGGFVGDPHIHYTIGEIGGYHDNSYGDTWVTVTIPTDKLNPEHELSELPYSL